jgi:hypothetical protein
MGTSEARGAKEGDYGGKVDRANRWRVRITPSRLVWPHGFASLRGGGNGRLAGRLGFSCRDVSLTGLVDLAFHCGVCGGG